jgi:hypothetical protein
MTKPPGRLKEQVQETVREIPVQAARLALFGVGRTLLLTDRVRKDYKEARESGLRPVLERWRDDAERVAVKVAGTVSERVSGARGQRTAEPAETAPRQPVPEENESLAAEPAAPPSPDRVTKAAPDATAAPEPAAEPVPAPDRVTKLNADSLPVPDYDTATLASVRARLRSLTAAQVSQLRDYEQEHAARADFLRMYENRIAKLTSGS